MLVFPKALCARLFTSAVQIVERAQTVFRHLNGVIAYPFIFEGEAVKTGNERFASY